MTYRMIAIDLDGTLFNREGRVSHANAAAVPVRAAAQTLAPYCRQIRGGYGSQSSPG